MSRIRRRFAIGWLAAAALVFTTGPRAETTDDRPVVRVEAERKRLVVGESTMMRVTVLAPSWFPAPPVFPAFDIPNAAVRLPPDSSFPTSESRGAVTWSGIVRDYVFQPLQPGRFEIEGERVRVTYMDPESSDRKSVEVPMPAIAFDAFVPAGAEGLDPFLSGRSIEISQEIDGNLDALAAGSAVVRRVEVRVDGMSAMFVPPIIPDQDVSGMSVYPRSPRIDDEGTVGVRRETATYVFERGGDYQIPSIRLAYWNTRTRSIETVEEAAVELSVAGASIGAGVRDPASRARFGVVAAILLLSIGILGWLFRRLPGRFLGHAREARRRVEASEWLAWRRLRHALGRSDPREITRRYVLWAEHPALVPGAAQPGVLDGLRRAGFGRVDESDSSWSPTARRALRAALKQERRKRLVHRRSGRSVVLPGLNPVGLGRVPPL